VKIHFPLNELFLGKWEILLKFDFSIGIVRRLTFGVLFLNSVIRISAATGSASVNIASVDLFIFAFVETS